MSVRSLTKILSTSSELGRIAIEDLVGLLHHPAIEADDRLEVMLALTRRKPAAVFWPVFHATWQTCENTFRIRNRLLKLLSARDTEARSTDYLASEARELFEGLPNPFTAYRGCSKSRVMGLSWTTSETAAQEFARGDGVAERQKPSVVTASVPKSAVFGVYGSGAEVDLVINPRRARLSVHPLALIKKQSSPYAEWEQLVERVRLEHGDEIDDTPAVPPSSVFWIRKLMHL